MQSVLGIQNAFHYWQEIVQPNAIEYGRTRSARSAFNLATSLWHLQEWVVVQMNPDVSKKELESEKSKLMQALLQQCPELGVLHDIATASKHGMVSRPKGDVAASSAEITAVHFCFAESQPVTEHAAEMLIELKDGSVKKLEQVLGAAFNYWNHYLPILLAPAGAAEQARGDNNQASGNFGFYAEN